MADQRADFEKKATVRDEKQYEDVVGALTEVGRDIGRGSCDRLRGFQHSQKAQVDSEFRGFLGFRFVHKEHMKNLEEHQILTSRW